MNALMEEASITYPSGIRRKQHMPSAHAHSNDWILEQCILGNIDAKDWVFLFIQYGWLCIEWKSKTLSIPLLNSCWVDS